MMEDQHSKALLVSLNVLVGFFIFFTLERTLTASAHGHSHPHSHTHENEEGIVAVVKATEKKRSNSKSRGRSASPAPVRKSSCSKSSSSSKSKSKSKSNNNSVSGTIEAMKANLTMSGWLNIAADSMHNFTDGLAIGASFTGAGGGMHCLGLAAFLSVMFHEIPHEIGDFTILVNSGLTKSQAIRAQFVTAIAAFIGTACGLIGASNSEVVKALLLSWTAGGFLYISTVSMIPTVLAPDKGDRKEHAMQGVYDAAGFVGGVAMMLGVALLEDEHSHSH
jgi:zinc transporter 7